MCILGARPEARKMAHRLPKLNDYSAFENQVCISEQHSEMLHLVLDLHQIFKVFHPLVVFTYGDMTTWLHL